MWQTRYAAQIPPQLGHKVGTMVRSQPPVAQPQEGACQCSGQGAPFLRVTPSRAEQGHLCPTRDTSNQQVCSIIWWLPLPNLVSFLSQWTIFTGNSISNTSYLKNSTWTRYFMESKTLLLYASDKGKTMPNLRSVKMWKNVHSKIDNMW